MPEILSVIKLRLIPDEQIISILDDQSRKCNSLYNLLLEKANHFKEEFKKTGNLELAKILYSKFGLRNLVPVIKNERPYFKTVYSALLKNVALLLANAIKIYRDWLKGKRAGRKVGWPKFKSFKRFWFSLFFDEPNTGYKIESNFLHLSLGLSPERKRRFIKIPIIGSNILKNKQIRNLRIVKENNVFSAVFTVIRIVAETKPINKIIALDPNHKNLSYGVDNNGKAIEIQSPYWLKKFDIRIDELKSRRDRLQKKSREIIKYDDEGNIIHKYWMPSKKYLRLEKVYKSLLAKRREQTKAFCFRISNVLFKKYDLVAIGDYTPNGQGITQAMRRAMNNRSLIGRFKKILSWVAKKSGKTYIEFPEKGTTRTCHACGFVNPTGIALDLRQWTCPSCSINHIRDENAACNGLIKIQKNLKESEANASPVPSSGRVQIKERWAWKVLSSGALVHCGGKIAELSALARN